MKATHKRVIDGYNLTMGKVNELIILGYTVTLSRPKSSFDKVEPRYNTEDNLPPEMWRNVGITIDKDHSIDKVFDIQSELNEAGIGFDTGFGGGVRDWEIDWSFSVKIK